MRFCKRSTSVGKSDLTSVLQEVLVVSLGNTLRLATKDATSSRKKLRMTTYKTPEEIEAGDLLWYEIKIPAPPFHVMVIVEVLDTKHEKRRAEIALLNSDRSTFWVSFDMLYRRAM